VLSICEKLKTKQDLTEAYSGKCLAEIILNNKVNLALVHNQTKQYHKATWHLFVASDGLGEVNMF
jgi:hypothetical protein